MDINKLESILDNYLERYLTIRREFNLQGNYQMGDLYYAKFLYAPMNCHGSYQIVKDWIKNHPKNKI